MPGNRGAFVDMHLAMGAQFLACHRGALDQLDIGAGDLAGMGVRLTDRAGHGHRVMGHQSLLDLGRIDVVTSAYDQVLGAPGNPEIPVGIDPAQIPGPEVIPVVDRSRFFSGSV